LSNYSPNGYETGNLKVCFFFKGARYTLHNDSQFSVPIGVPLRVLTWREAPEIFVSIMEALYA
jgi:hypothetical protein